jgi:hypothetical protein
MIDASSLGKNSLHLLAKQPHTPVAAGSLFGILSYRMVILGQFGSTIVPWRQGKQNFHPSSSLELRIADGHQVTPAQRGSNRRTERFETK